MATERVMSDEELEQWKKLYYYVKKDILNYDGTQGLPREVVLRLKGLRSGRFMENYSTDNTSNYSFDIILYTFQICKPSIKYALETKDFKNEQAKINYIFKIVERNLNDVYERVTRARKVEESIEEVDTEILTNDNVAEYKKKTKETKNKRLADMM